MLNNINQQQAEIEKLICLQILMIQESNCFKVGFYVDYKTGATWTSRIITNATQQQIEISQITDIYPIKKMIKISSEDVQPYRKNSKLQPSSSIVSVKNFNQSAFYKNLKQLENFSIANINSCIDIIQFLRGRNFYFIKDIFSLRITNQETVKHIKKYLETYLQFIIRYCKELSLPDTEGDLYSSINIAYLSSFDQVFYLTRQIVGAGNWQKIFTKQNNKILPQKFFQSLIKPWYIEFLKTIPMLKIKLFGLQSHILVIANHVHKIGLNPNEQCQINPHKQKQILKQTLYRYFSLIPEKISYLSYRNYEQFIQNNEHIFADFLFTSQDQGQANYIWLLTKLLLLSKLLGKDQEKGIEQLHQKVRPPSTSSVYPNNIFTKLKTKKCIQYFQNWIIQTKIVDKCINKVLQFPITKIIIHRIAPFMTNNQIKKSLYRFRVLNIQIKKRIKDGKMEQQEIFNGKTFEEKQSLALLAIQLADFNGQSQNHKRTIERCFQFLPYISHWSQQYKSFLEKCLQDEIYVDLAFQYLDNLVTESKQNKILGLQESIGKYIEEQLYIPPPQVMKNWIDSFLRQCNASLLHVYRQRLKNIETLIRRLERQSINQINKQRYMQYFGVLLQTLLDNTKPQHYRFQALKFFRLDSGRYFQFISSQRCQHLLKIMGTIKSNFQFLIFLQLFKNINKDQLDLQFRAIVVVKTPVKYLSMMLYALIYMHQNQQVQLKRVVEQIYFNLNPRIREEMLANFFDFFLSQMTPSQYVFKLIYQLWVYYNDCDPEVQKVVLNNSFLAISSKNLKSFTVKHDGQEDLKIVLTDDAVLEDLKFQIAKHRQINPDSIDIYCQGQLVITQNKTILKRIFEEQQITIQDKRNGITQPNFCTKLLLERKLALFTYLPYSSLIYGAIPRTKQYEEQFLTIIHRQPFDDSWCNYFEKLQQFISIIKDNIEIVLPQLLYKIWRCLKYPISAKHLHLNNRIFDIIYNLEEQSLSDHALETVETVIFIASKADMPLHYVSNCHYANIQKKTLNCYYDNGIKILLNKGKPDPFRYYLQQRYEVLDRYYYLDDLYRAFTWQWIQKFNDKPLQQKISYFSSFENKLLKNNSGWRHFLLNIQAMVTHHKTQPAQRNFIKSILQRSLKCLNENYQIDSVILSPFLNIVCQVMKNNKSLVDCQNKLYLQFCQKFIFQGNYAQFCLHLEEIYTILKVVIHNKQIRSNLAEFISRQYPKLINQTTSMQMTNSSKHQVNKVGLNNLATVCYANAFLQQLFYSGNFSNQFLHAYWQRKQKPEQDLILQMKKIFYKLKFNKTNKCMNRQFFNAIKTVQGKPTSIYIQNDCDQFKSLLFAQLQQALPKGNNLVKKYFEGKLSMRITSKQCEHSSIKQQLFSSINLNVINLQNLHQSLQHYFLPQILHGQNSYYCQECKKKVQAVKSSSIVQYPPNLIFVLKRFQYSVSQEERKKINEYFQFPIHQLQMNQVKYKLKGVVIHEGSVQIGHYTSIVNFQGYSCFFNDNKVDYYHSSKIPQNSFGFNSENFKYYLNSDNRTLDYADRNAYLLFYELVEPLKQPVQADMQSQERNQQDYYGIKDEVQKWLQQCLIYHQKKWFCYQLFWYCILQGCKIQTRLEKGFTTYLQTMLFLYLDIRPKMSKFENFIDMEFWLQFKKIPIHKLMNQHLVKMVSFFSNTTAQYDIKAMAFEVFLQNMPKLDQTVCIYVVDSLIKSKINEMRQNFNFLYKIAKKFPEMANYMRKQKLVGRILLGIFNDFIGSSQVKGNLKQDVKNPMKIQSKLVESIQDIKYTKWQLLFFLIENHYQELSKQEKMILQNGNQNTFAVYLKECSNKICLKYISKILVYLSSKLPHYENCLVTFLNRKFLTFPDLMSSQPRILLKIEEDLINLQSKIQQQKYQLFLNAILQNIKSLQKKIVTEKLIRSKQMKYLHIFLQSFISICGRNQLFRIRAYEKRNLFPFDSKWIKTVRWCQPTQNKLQLQFFKNPLYGFKIPHNDMQFNQYADKICSNIDKILNNRQNLDPIELQYQDLNQMPLEQMEIIFEFNKKAYEAWNVKQILGQYIQVEDPDDPENIKIFMKSEQKLAIPITTNKSKSINRQKQNGQN